MLLMQGFQKNPVAWYGIMIADVVMLFSLAVVTLPLYNLTVHTVQVKKDAIHGGGSSKEA